MPKSQILMIRYGSERNEVFNTASTPSCGYGATNRDPADGIRAGMKYKELKHIYHYGDWYSVLGNKHNPALMEVYSWLIPGLGQMISDEVGRGLGWFGGAVGCSVFMEVGAGVSAGAEYYNRYDWYYDEEQAITGTVLLLAGSLAMLTVDICAIVDACRVAKVRNVYEQDLKKMNYSFEQHPSVDYIRIANGVQPTAGLTFAMRF